MKAAAYIRVSTEEQSKGESLEAQLAACQEYAERQGWEIAEVYEDVQSGLDANRPNWQKLLADAKEGQFEAVVVWRYDRFGRDPADAFPAIKDLKRLGVALHSASEGNDSFVGKLMLILAEKESENTSERVRLDMKALARQGKWVSRPPIGYDIMPAPPDKDGRVVGRVLTPNDDAPLITRLFEMYADGTASIADLQRKAAEMGLKINGRVVDRQRIDVILRNPVYVGKVVYGRNSNGKFTGRRKQDDYIEADGLHPAIVDKATWDAVQRRLAFNREHHTAPKQTDYLLTSFIFCGHCGGRMYGQRLKRKGGSFYYHYRCQNGVAYKTCKLHYVSGPRIDQAVKEKLAGLLPQVTPDKLEGARRLILNGAARHMAAERKEVGRLRAQRQKQIKRIKDLANKFLSERIPAEVYDEMAAEANEALARIDADLEAARSDGTQRDYAKTVEAIFKLMERVPWPPAPDNFRGWRKVVETSVERVDVYSKDKVRVTLNAVAQANTGRDRKVYRKGGPPCAGRPAPG
jgi:site-specific DNA recombinase